MALEIGHEYGHHVQVLAGILSSIDERAKTLNGIDGQFEDTRRMGLQASCLHTSVTYRRTGSGRLETDRARVRAA